MEPRQIADSTVCPNYHAHDVFCHNSEKLRNGYKNAKQIGIGHNFWIFEKQQESTPEDQPETNIGICPFDIAQLG